MKRFLVKIILLIILFFSIDYLFGLSFERLYFKVKSGTIYSTVYGLRECHEDILLMGASQVSHNFASRQIEDSLGMTCYNLGLDAHNIYYQYAILREILDRYIPSVIVITTDVIAENERTINSLFPLRKRYERMEDIIFDISPGEKYRLMSDSYAYNSLLIKIIQGMIVKEPATNGFKPIFERNPHIRKEEIDTTNYSSKRTLGYFEKFIDAAKASGCFVVVVNTPKYVDCSIKKGPSFLTEIIDRNKVLYLDYECDTTYGKHPEYFKDKVHLNDSGAEIFTANFITDLKKNIELNKKKQGSDNYESY